MVRKVLRAQQQQQRGGGGSLTLRCIKNTTVNVRIPPTAQNIW
jgi:hypothetical protein